MIEYFNILSCPFISEKGSILGQKSRTPTYNFFFFFCQLLIKSSFFLSLLTPSPSKPRACCVSLQLCTCSLFHQLMPGRIYYGQGPSVTLCRRPTWSYPFTYYRFPWYITKFNLFRTPTLHQIWAGTAQRVPESSTHTHLTIGLQDVRTFFFNPLHLFLQCNNPVVCNSKLWTKQNNSKCTKHTIGRVSFPL